MRSILKDSPRIRDTLLRVWRGFVELTDAVIDIFVEPLKKLMPWKLPFGRPDNKVRWRWVSKETGYYVGHLIGIPVALAGFVVVGKMSEFILAFAWMVIRFVYTLVAALFGADVHW